MPKLRALTSVALLTCFGVQVRGAELELFVSPEGDDAASGEARETPLRSLTEAVARVRAEGGGTIWVFPGTYTEPEETFPIKLPARTRVAALDPDTKPVIGFTRVNSVFWVEDIPREIVPWPEEGEPPWPEPDPDGVVLSGLRIEDGGGCPGGAGGGILVRRGSVQLLDCDLIANKSGDYGGGIGAAQGSKVIAERCRIKRNTRYGCGVVVTAGAGVALLTGSVGAFRDCEISENREGEGEAGFYVRLSQLFLRDCRVLDNYGACLFAPHSNLYIERSVLSGHPRCCHPPLEVFYGRLILRDSLIYGNGVGGKVVIVSETPAIIDGCVVAYNETSGAWRPADGGQALYASGSDERFRVVVSNSIFWANNFIGDSHRTEPPPPWQLPDVLIVHGEVRYSILQNSMPPQFQVTYDHVIEADPLFRDFMTGDFSLLEGSPAIDAGDPSSPPDPDGSRRDIGVKFPELVGRTVFMRGDPNNDNVIDISDAIKILLGLFNDPALLPCLDAADADDNGVLSITDAVAILRFFFADLFPAPVEPYGYFGVDWTNDDPLDCTW
jgi:hypothetical protein